ncbi:MAG: hydrogenase nickel incorporation protein HybF [Deltaproteobacteria bacterium ADurb.Bin510]|nr:MAG: hydrogenase nickel incorporation protein HybF [Deltaproteobacteria bacterium ADurb.Bin510]
MHEFAVTKHMTELVLKEAERAGASKVTDIYLAIGDISSFINESVQLYFDMYSKDTIAAGAKLHFRRIQAEFVCRACGQSFTPRGESFDCPACGGLGKPTDKGHEFYVEKIDIV